jgi:serine/threonine protein kinase
MAEDATPVTTPQTDAGPTAAEVARVPPAAATPAMCSIASSRAAAWGAYSPGAILRLQRTVAIKMLRAQDTSLAIRFEREVKLAARLQHPGIVPVYDAGFCPAASRSWS